MTQRTYHAIAAALADEAVDVVFGVMSGVIDRLILELVEQHDVQYIAARHEQGAVGMADGYARATGKVGVAALSRGPGLTNAATALTAARLSRVPLVAIVADKPIGSRFGNMDIDQEPLSRATAGNFQPLGTPASLGSEIQSAFRHALLGHGPSVLNYRYDLLEEVMPPNWHYVRAADSLASPAPQPPPGTFVAAVHDQLAASRRPLLLAGRGAVLAGARTDLIELADTWDAKLATTLLAKGWFRGIARDLGICGGFATPERLADLRRADLVVAFGASLNPYTRDHGRLFSDVPVIQIDNSPDRIGEHGPVALAVVADAALTARELLTLSPDGRTAGTDWALTTPTTPAPRIDREEAGFVDRHLLAETVNEVLPKRRQLVVGLGHFMGAPAAVVDVADPRDVVFPWRLGTIGAGIPAALGASIGRRDLPTVLFEGDGSLMMTLSELDTAVRYRLPILVICEDDGGYGAERVAEEDRGVVSTINDFVNPDFAQVMAAFGFKAATVHRNRDLRPVLESLLPIDGPRFLNVKISPRDRDHRMVHAHLPPSRTPRSEARSVPG